MEKMYGLFYYSYDYYEWENLIAVSENKKLLESKYKSLEGENSRDQIKLFHSKIKHNKLADKDKPHYFIKQVEYLK